MIDTGQGLSAGLSRGDDAAGRARGFPRQPGGFLSWAPDDRTAGIAVVSGREMRIEWANATLQEHFRRAHPGANLAGWRLGDFIPQFEESGLAEIFRRVAASRERCSDLEYEYDDPRSGPTFWRFSLQPLGVGEDEASWRLMVQIENITGEVRARKRHVARRVRVKVRSAGAEVESAPAEQRRPAVPPDELSLGSWRYQ